MTDEAIREALQPLLKDGMLACRDALATAARLGIPPGRVGQVCNRHEIRIINCQLGCFGTQRSKPR